MLSAARAADGRRDGRRQAEQTVKVTTQRLYHLLSRPKAGSHDLQLRFSPGVAGYAFTFG